MGEAKRRGTFEDRKKSSKYTRPTRIRISYESFPDYCQATIILEGTDQQIVLKAPDVEKLSYLLLAFGAAYQDNVLELVHSIAPQLYHSLFDEDEHQDENFGVSVSSDLDEISSIFGVELVPLTDDFYHELVKIDGFKDMSKSDFDSLRSNGFLYNSVRQSFQMKPEFSGFFDE